MKRLLAQPGFERCFQIARVFATAKSRARTTPSSRC